MDPLITTKVVGEAAKAADAAADAVEKVGALIDRSMGGIVSNAIGLVADKLAYYRLEKAILLKDKVDKRLADKGIKTSRHVPVSFGLPLIEKATVEEDDSLHDKWANLLSNAMDPTYSGNLSRGFVDILSSLEAIDARIFDLFTKEFAGLSATKQKETLFDRSNLITALGEKEEVVSLSLRNLMRLGLIKPGIITGGISLGSEPITIYKDIDMFAPTELGVQFYKAVST